MEQKIFHWENEPEFWSATTAERARIGGYELVAFDIPPHLAKPRTIGWELFTGHRLSDLVATGGAESYEAAKAAAERAYLVISHNLNDAQDDTESSR